MSNTPYARAIQSKANARRLCREEDAYAVSRMYTKSMSDDRKPEIMPYSENVLNAADKQTPPSFLIAKLLTRARYSKHRNYRVAFR